eukprot:1170-Eustigmatos_ZCMA.PRE.1
MRTNARQKGSQSCLMYHGHREFQSKHMLFEGEKPRSPQSIADPLMDGPSGAQPSSLGAHHHSSSYAI